MNMSSTSCHRANGIMSFPILNNANIFHAVFSRSNGSSPPPWDSLNVSPGVGDSAENVAANRAHIKKELGVAKLVSAQQVHGSTIKVILDEPPTDCVLEACDGLLTSVPGLGLMIQQADCQAVFLYDPAHNAVGVIHSGWRGSVANILDHAVQEMRRSFTTKPTDLIAAISPSLGPCCAEFIHYQHELPAHFHTFQVRKNYFDFWAISRAQLLTAGLQGENISAANVCTVCDPDYFSYRRDRTTGRFASIIGIRP